MGVYALPRKRIHEFLDRVSRVRILPRAPCQALVNDQSSKTGRIVAIPTTAPCKATRGVAKVDHGSDSSGGGHHRRA